VIVNEDEAIHGTAETIRFETLSPAQTEELVSQVFFQKVAKSLPTLGPKAAQVYMCEQHTAAFMWWHLSQAINGTVKFVISQQVFLLTLTPEKQTMEKASSDVKVIENE
jgi:hypothetical protein